MMGSGNSEEWLNLGVSIARDVDLSKKNKFQKRPRGREISCIQVPSTVIQASAKYACPTNPP
jgi:hypothetical protein